jgi:hypothetical protein
MKANLEAQASGAKSAPPHAADELLAALAAYL